MARQGNVTVRITYNRFPAIARQLPQEAMAIVGETLEEIDATVQAGLAAGGRGRIYIRRGRSHQASAPGDMPANDYGNLAGSLQHELNRSGRTGYYYTTAEYAPFLEFGTIKMAARPFMTPSAEQARAGFMRKMRRLESRLT